MSGFGSPRRATSASSGRTKRKIVSAMKNGFLDASISHNPDITGKLTLEDTYVDVYSGLKLFEKMGCDNPANNEYSRCTLDKLRLEKDLRELKQMGGRHFDIYSEDSASHPSIVPGEGRYKRAFTSKGSQVSHNLSERRKAEGYLALQKQREKLKAKQEVATERRLATEPHDVPKGLPVWKHAPCLVGSSHSFSSSEKTGLSEAQLKMLAEDNGFLSFETFFHRNVVTNWPRFVNHSIIEFVVLQQVKVGLLLHSICLSCHSSLYNSGERRTSYRRNDEESGTGSGVCCVSFRVAENMRYLLKITFPCKFDHTERKRCLFGNGRASAATMDRSLRLNGDAKGVMSSSSSEAAPRSYMRKNFNWDDRYLKSEYILDKRGKEDQMRRSNDLGVEDCDYSIYAPTHPSQRDIIEVVKKFAFVHFTEEIPEKSYFTCVCKFI